MTKTRWVVVGLVCLVAAAVGYAFLQGGPWETHMAAGDKAYQQGNYDRAIEDYDEAIRLKPDYAVAYDNRCWAYGLMRRPNEALRDCNESLRLRPDNDAILDSRALAYWLLNEHDKARKDLDRARQINPSTRPWQERFREFKGMF